MKKIFPFLIIAILTAASFTIAGDVKSPSRIISVTVYNDQALITREAKPTVPAGTSTLIVPDLPALLQDASLKVTGSSETGAKISDIRIDRVFLDTVPPGRLADLYSRMNTLKNEKNTLERGNLILRTQLETVTSMMDNYVKSLALQPQGQKISTEEWEKALQFMERKKTEYADRMEIAQKEINTKVVRIKSLEEEIATIGGVAKKEMKQVTVTVNAERAGAVRLEVSYLIYGAAWLPSYEVRAENGGRTMQIGYMGNVRQSTGESWDNVRMILSTARPAASERAPELWQWTVDSRPSPAPVHVRGSGSVENGVMKQERPMVTFNANTITGRVVDLESNEPLVGANVLVMGRQLGATTNANGEYVIYNVPAGTYALRASFIGYQVVTVTGVTVNAMTGSQQNFSLSASSVQLQEVVIASERPVINKSVTSSVRMGGDVEEVAPEESSVSSQVTSSAFTVRSPQTIPSDNTPHKVGIVVDEVPVQLVYHVVPKVSQAAFLLGKGKNAHDYPLLEGEANIFVDNAFVASVGMKTVMPNDSFSVNLGVDEGIRVSRKQVKKFTESKGTFTSKTRTSFEYENVVENFKKIPVDIVFFDHVPVAANEDFTVIVTDPDPKQVPLPADGIYRRPFTLKPSEKLTVPLKFSVEYPQGNPPYGLGR